MTGWPCLPACKLCPGNDLVSLGRAAHRARRASLPCAAASKCVCAQAPTGAHHNSLAAAAACDCGCLPAAAHGTIQHLQELPIGRIERHLRR